MIEIFLKNLAQTEGSWKRDEYSDSYGCLSLILHQHLTSSHFLKGCLQCGIWNHYQWTFCTLLYEIPGSVFHTEWIFYTLHDFLTAHTVHLGNTGPPSYIDLANTDTIHYTITFSTTTNPIRKVSSGKLCSSWQQICSPKLYSLL